MTPAPKPIARRDVKPANDERTVTIAVPTGEDLEATITAWLRSLLDKAGTPDEGR